MSNKNDYRRDLNAVLLTDRCGRTRRKGLSGSGLVMEDGKDTRVLGLYLS